MLRTFNTNTGGESRYMSRERNGNRSGQRCLERGGDGNYEIQEDGTERDISSRSE